MYEGDDSVVRDRSTKWRSPITSGRGRPEKTIKKDLEANG